MAEGGAGRAARAILVAIIALLAGVQVIRATAVADHDRRPALAGVLWPSHPAVLDDQVLLAVATAAAHGQAVPGATRVDLRRLAEKAPLSPDPFLIEGAIAQTKGDGAAAERFLLEARSRDPRSRGTRFLLAEQYLRTGRVTAALSEIHVLVGLNPRGAEPFQPMLVAYARTPGAVRHLKPFFARHPDLEANVLSQLAGDAGNANLVLSLANHPTSESGWRGALVSALATAGQYAKAHAVWVRLSGLRAAPLGLFNPGFAASAAPPPFNWSFPESGEGIAEPDGKGGLEVLYYGRAKAVLANQLILLRQGNYRLALRAVDASGEPGSLHWIVRCAGSDLVLLDLPLRSGVLGTDFRVPAGCPAQWVELQGQTGDVPQTTGLRVRDLRLAAESPQ